MALKNYKPTSPGLRQLVIVDRSELYKGKPEKTLTVGLTKTGGRDNYGHVTSRRIGGGHKRKLRVIDFKRRKFDLEATVEKLLVQIQSDMLFCDVVRPEITESTALGAARLAMLGCGMVKDKSEFSACKNTVFTPRDIMDTYVLKSNWERAINAALTWAGR